MSFWSLFFGFITVFSALVIPIIPDDLLYLAVALVCGGAVGFLLLHDPDEDGR